MACAPARTGNNTSRSTSTAFRNRKQLVHEITSFPEIVTCPVIHREPGERSGAGADFQQRCEVKAVARRIVALSVAGVIRPP